MVAMIKKTRWLIRLMLEIPGVIRQGFFCSFYATSSIKPLVLRLQKSDDANNLASTPRAR
jgi:hypothetical protein